MMCVIPLLRGDEGVCYGERRSKGRGVTISRFEKLVAAKSEVLSVGFGCLL